ncbi:lysophospholipid acyltransferase family protein [Alkalibacillus haloalkaliphilus]|uniref:lysophospholipid acyltransferase family protein n=1 Tax=Alkalibacillus haloalkaliphilus TaxID=94136 RepID=UPI0002F47ECF|nr:lysophospholipid acyltransferase family protein [Alkalibacillus haloalkaliphilus]
MLYALLKSIARLIIPLHFKINVTGKENIRLEQPLVIASNHTSAFDPLILACIIDQELHFLAKKELFRNQLLTWVLTNIKAIPVDRHSGNTIVPVRRCLKVLDENGTLGIFPEGTCCKEGEKIQPKKGVAFFSSKTSTPILPIYINYYKQGIRPAVDVQIGSLIKPELQQDLDYTAYTTLVMNNITTLKNRSLYYRGLLDEYSDKTNKII